MLSLLEEWKPLITKNQLLKDKFDVGYLDNKKTSLRKCRKCCARLICKDSTTAPLLSHLLGTGCRPRLDQQASTTESIEQYMVRHEDRYPLPGKLVYIDNLPITLVCESPNLKEFYWKANFEVPDYPSLNMSLNALYAKRFRELKAYFTRDNAKLILRIDWRRDSTFDKFIGIFVFQKDAKVFIQEIYIIII